MPMATQILRVSNARNLREMSTMRKNARNVREISENWSRVKFQSRKLGKNLLYLYDRNIIYLVGQGLSANSLEATEIFMEETTGKHLIRLQPAILRTLFLRRYKTGQGTEITIIPELTI